jgi:PTH1 family peptidyl-tRNA hydrolase
MNNCGELIHKIVTAEKMDFLVVLDDINLPLGRMRIRSKGSDGGHRGLRSIIDSVGHEEFPRLRIGIGRPSNDAADYVLERFSTGEKLVLRKVMKEGVRGIEMLLVEGFEKAQNYINSIKIELDSNSSSKK